MQGLLLALLAFLLFLQLPRLSSRRNVKMLVSTAKGMKSGQYVKHGTWCVQFARKIRKDQLFFNENVGHPM